MKTTIKVRNSTPTNANARRHLDHRVAELARRLPQRVGDAASLTVVVDSLPKKALTRMSVRLALPGRLLTAADEGKDEMGVVNRVFGELNRRLSKVRQHRARLHPAAVTAREAVRSQPVLGAQDINALFRFIEGEMELAASRGETPAGGATPREVLSDVLLMALEGWEKRPEGFAVSPFLFRLAVDRIRRKTPQAPGEPPGEVVSLDTRQPRNLPEDRPSGVNQDYWEYWQPDDSPAMEDTLQVGGSDDPFDAIYHEEERRLLLRLLARVGQATRQAVLLHELEAFEPEEIALIQGRGKEEVERDLAEGRRLLDRAEGS